MSQASFKQKKRGDGSRSAGPDGGSFPKDGKLSVTKKDGRANTGKGSYEHQTQLDRGAPKIIKYQ